MQTLLSEKVTKQHKTHKLPKMYLKKNWKKIHNFQNFTILMSSIDIAVSMETN